jgi:hypothetical protein
MDNWEKLKQILAIMNQEVYHGFLFSERNLQDLIHIRNEIMNKKQDEEENPYCPTCGSCGKENCCPPSKCKFGLSYVSNLQNELLATRKALAIYIKKAGWEPSEKIIDQEIKFYGHEK